MIFHRDVSEPVYCKVDYIQDDECDEVLDKVLATRLPIKTPGNTTTEVLVSSYNHPYDYNMDGMKSLEEPEDKLMNDYLSQRKDWTREELENDPSVGDLFKKSFAKKDAEEAEAAERLAEHTRLNQPVLVKRKVVEELSRKLRDMANLLDSLPSIN